MAVSIHPMAVVEDGAQLGVDVTVGPFALVEAGAVVGDRCRLQAGAQVKRLTTLGAENVLHAHCVVGGDPQDLKHQGEDTVLTIGERNTIREYVTIHRGTVGGGGATVIGSGCLLMAYVHVAHDCRLGDGVIVSNSAGLAGHVEVGDGAIISAMTGVHQFVRVGQCAFLGAMSGLAQDLPPFMLAAGTRAKVHGPNMVGLRRMGFNSGQIAALKSAYKTIWLADTPRAEALDQVEAAHPDSPEIKALTAFIRASERGVPLAARDRGGDED